MNVIYKAIVVDDERLARQKLINMLKKHEMIEVTGEAGDVSSATKLIKKEKPDIVFLDIQMPGQTGFELLEYIDYPLKIVFVTAYDEYAVKAFEVNALDYLMKPVREERLDNLIHKLEQGNPTETNISSLDYSDRLFVSDDKQMKFINISDIVLIRSVGNYTRLFLNNNSHITVYKPVREWEERLPVKKFCRVHRTSIINIDYVEHIERWFNYSSRVTLRGIDEPVGISRKYSGILKERFG